MNGTIVVPGRFTGGAFVPDGPLPNAEGAAELIIRPNQRPKGPSIFELIGKAPVTRTAEDIAARLREERDAWGEP